MNQKEIDLFINKLEKKILFVKHYFKGNVDSFTYYFFSQVIILLSRESSFEYLGIILAIFFFIGGLSTSSSPNQEDYKVEELALGLLIGAFMPLFVGLSIILLLIT